MKEATSRLLRAEKYWGPDHGFRKGMAEYNAMLKKDPEDWKVMNDQSSLLYYAADNAANVQAVDKRRLFIARIFWKIYAWWLLERALHLLDRVWKLTPETFITAEMCDVRQSILLAAAELLWHRHRLDDAQHALGVGMRINKGKIPRYIRLLLELRELDVVIRRRYSPRVIEMSLKSLIDQAALAVGDLPEDAEIETRVEHFRQYALVYRHIAARCRDVGWTDSAKKYAEKALRLGYESRAFDQIAKISL